MNADWPMRPLGELFEIGAGKTMSVAARTGEHKVPFLRTSNVLWDRIDLTNLDEMAIPAHELAEKSLRVDDLLVCEGGEIGRAAVWDGRLPAPISFQNHLHRLRPRVADVEPRFYVFFLQSAFTQLGLFEGAGNNTTIPNLSSGRLAALEVPHPPLPVQEAVVRVLSQVRKAQTVHEQISDLASELRRTTMHQVISRGLRKEERTETEIGPVPASWTVGPVGEFAEFQRGFDITKSEQVESGPVPVVSSGGVKSFHNVPKIAGPGVVIGRKGSIGALHYIASDYWPHDTTLWCKDYRGNLPKFVFYRLQLLDLKRLDSGAANPALNRNFLHAELISWPGLDEQAEIVHVLDTLDQKIDLHQRKHDVLEELFMSLLHKLMTGEITLENVDFLGLPAETRDPGEAVA